MSQFNSEDIIGKVLLVGLDYYNCKDELVK